MRKPKEIKKKEFLVSDNLGNFFCGYLNGRIYWSDKISEARELEEERHFNSLVRWEKTKQLKKEYI